MYYGEQSVFYFLPILCHLWTVFLIQSGFLVSQAFTLHIVILNGIRVIFGGPGTLVSETASGRVSPAEPSVGIADSIKVSRFYILSVCIDLITSVTIQQVTIFVNPIASQSMRLPSSSTRFPFSSI